METTQRSKPTQRRAVIDIGTNSVKVLVADVSAADVCPVFEDSLQTRLGQGFYETHLLQPPAIAKTVEAVAIFAESARKLGAQTIRVIATSAARDAKNPYDLTVAVAHKTGLVVEIISGEQEAEWAYQGVALNLDFVSRPTLLLDVGGGSSEFILGCGAKMEFRRSFPLGVVRMLERLPVSDPPKKEEFFRMREWIAGFLREEVRTKLAGELMLEEAFNSSGAGGQLIGTGGTAVILARIKAAREDFERVAIESVTLTASEVSGLCDRLWSLSLASRRQIKGLPGNRADVVLAGALIYSLVMNDFAFRELRVSTRGLRFAVVRDEFSS